jgi:hypothetical protein
MILSPLESEAAVVLFSAFLILNLLLLQETESKGGIEPGLMMILWSSN